MPILSSKGISSSNFSLSYTGDADLTDGSSMMKPGYIEIFGNTGSGNISGNGIVNFTTANAISIFNVFNANYENYIIRLTIATSAADSYIYSGLIAGSNYTSNSNQYSTQETYRNASNGLTTGLIYTSAMYPTYSGIGNGASVEIKLFSPNLAQRTAWLNDGCGSFYYRTIAIHDLTTSYDGIYFGSVNANITGRVSIYGMRS